MPGGTLPRSRAGQPAGSTPVRSAMPVETVAGSALTVPPVGPALSGPADARPVAYVSVDVDLPEWTEDYLDSDPEDSGYSLGAGVRTRFAERFEAEANVQYANLSDYGDEFEFGVMGRWYITDMFALGVGYSAGDETSTFYGSVRMEFGN